MKAIQDRHWSWGRLRCWTRSTTTSRKAQSHIYADNRFLSEFAAACTSATSGCNERHVHDLSMKEIESVTAIHSEMTRLLDMYRSPAMTSSEMRRKGRSLFKQELYKINVYGLSHPSYSMIHSFHVVFMTGKGFVLQNAQGAHRCEKMCRSNSIRINSWPRLRSVTLGETTLLSSDSFLGRLMYSRPFPAAWR